MNVKPEKVLELIETESDETLEKMTPELLGKAPNTYAFSKGLSEQLVAHCGLPAGVARPSIGKSNIF